MAGMFYSLQEVIDKLNKSEDEIHELVREGKLREFRDGANLLFKIDEVEGLAAEAGAAPETEVPVPVEEPSAVPEETPAAEEPQAVEEPPAVLEETPAAEEPQAVEEPSAVPEETPAAEEPQVVEEPSAVPEEPPAVEEPQVVEEPQAVEEPSVEEEPQGPTEEEEISLAAEEGASEEGELEDAESTAVAGEGISVLGESDADEYKLTDDTMAETRVTTGETSLLDEALDKTRGPSDEAALEEIEEDVSLDSFGSGSGLLDLSLQADDTSLGGILDEIYTPEGEEGKEAAEEAVAEAEQMLPEEEEIVMPEPVAEAPLATAAYAEPEVDGASGAFGIMLFLPLAVVLYTTIIAVAGQRNVTPSILRGIQGIIWYVLLGVAVAAGLIVGAGSTLGGEAATVTEKKKKSRKPPKAKKAEEAKAPEPAEDSGKSESEELELDMEADDESL